MLVPAPPLDWPPGAGKPAVGKFAKRLGVRRMPALFGENAARGRTKAPAYGALPNASRDSRCLRLLVELDVPLDMRSSGSICLFRRLASR